jgi:hypothetical protein
LLSTASYRVEAVHFAIALDELGLLDSGVVEGTPLLPETEFSEFFQAQRTILG